MTDESKVATEVAEQEFARFLDAMCIDVDQKALDADDRKSFENAKRRIIKAIETGSLVINELGEPVFTPMLGNRLPLTFHEPAGVSLLASDGHGKDHNTHKMYAVLGAQTKQPAKRFSLMMQRDLKVCEALFVVFFGQ